MGLYSIIFAFSLVIIQISGKPIVQSPETENTEIANLEKKYEEPKDQVNRIERLGVYNITISAPEPSDVYFTANPSADLQLTIGEKVVHGKNSSNQGSGYDPSTGIFTVPSPGVYSILVFSDSLKAGQIDLVLRINKGKLQSRSKETSSTAE